LPHVPQALGVQGSRNRGADALTAEVAVALCFVYEQQQQQKLLQHVCDLPSTSSGCEISQHQL
jgi:hypothetical protein